MSAIRAMSAYREASVSAASPEDILLLLIGEAVRSAERARLEQDKTERRRLIGKSMAIITELADTLNIEIGGEGAEQIFQLYIFVNARLGRAIAGDDEGLPEALRILRHLRETWEMAVDLARVERGER